MTYDEFKIRVSPDLQDPAQWSIAIEDCPLSMVKGPQGNIQPQVSAAQLAQLRARNGWPNQNALKTLGDAVFKTVMPAAVPALFQACFQSAQNGQRGLRLLVLSSGAVSGAGGPHEIPFEAAFHPHLGFLATNPLTPVSRAGSVAPDAEPLRVSPPLRILVVVSEPKDLPPVNAAAEKAALLESLKKLIDAQAVVVDFCEPPTLTELGRKLLDNPSYHVLHFIGHGDFDVDPASDLSPQPHLYLEDGSPARRRKGVQAEQFYAVLRDAGIGLVVLTACSTAAQSPNNAALYPGAAFEGMASTLIDRPAGPLAVIAMQFDLETDAAKYFTEEFYLKVLAPNWTVDRALAFARNQLFLRFGGGHRCWVNPTLYWRCRNGKVFEFNDISGTVTDQQKASLMIIDREIASVQQVLADVSRQPPEIQIALAGLRAEWQQRIQDLLVTRGQILGDTVRLRGGVADATGVVECRLTIQLRLPATIGDIDISLQPDAADFEIVSELAGASVPADRVFFQRPGAGGVRVSVRNASGGIDWAPGEYELACVTLRLKNAAGKSIYYVPMTIANVIRNGAATLFQTLKAAIFPNL